MSANYENQVDINNVVLEEQLSEDSKDQKSFKEKITLFNTFFEQKANNGSSQKQEKLLKELLGIVNSDKYKKSLSSSARRQMIINKLNEYNGIEDNCLDQLLKEDSFTRGAKTALLLSNKLTGDQKRKLITNDIYSKEIVDYSKRHNILNLVRGNLLNAQGADIIEVFVSKLFNNGNFVFPKEMRSFFYPDTFSTAEKKKIEKLLENKIENHDLINNLKIKMVKLLFEQISIEKRCKEFNDIYIKVMQYVQGIVSHIPDVLNQESKDNINVLLKHCESFSNISNTFILSYPTSAEDKTLNLLWNMSSGQGLTRITLPINDMAKSKINSNIGYPKNECLYRCREQIITQKSKYEVCRYYDGLSDKQREKLDSKKIYQLTSNDDVNCIDLENLCSKTTNGEIMIEPKGEFNVRTLNDSAMHQIATELNLLSEKEKFDIQSISVIYRRKPILLDNQELTVGDIIKIVNDKSEKTTKLKVMDIKRTEDGKAVIENGKQVLEYLEKTLYDLL